MYITNTKEFIQNEFSNLGLGDKRLNRRVMSVVASINGSPSTTIPMMTNGNRGQLKSIYRFFSNEKITDQNLLQTHYLNTIERMKEYKGKILIICDSTYVTPTKRFEGLLTRGKGKENCVRVHYALAVSEDGKHIFGILSLHILSDPINVRYPELRNESDIWIHVAEECLHLINSASNSKNLLPRCLLVADREADEFELLTFLKKHNFGFIIRSQYDRNVMYNDTKTKLNDIEDNAIKHGAAYSIKTKVNEESVEVKVERSILRDVTIMPPADLSKNYLPLTLNVVIVQNTSEGDEIKWRLLTSEAIPNAGASKTIVTSYTHRWTIEDMNKAAKTGVRIEDRQFTSLEHFLPFLAISFVVAWRIVALRTIAEIKPNAPLEEAFTEEEEAFLNIQAKQMELPMDNIHDGMYLIACLGGFTGSYARPGWIALWQGWMKFHERVQGFVLAHGP